MCIVVHNAFGHHIRVPHYFQTLGLIGFIYGLIIGMGPTFLSVPSPRPFTNGLKVKVTDLEFIVEVYSSQNISK